MSQRLARSSSAASVSVAVRGGGRARSTRLSGRRGRSGRAGVGRTRSRVTRYGRARDGATPYFFILPWSVVGLSPSSAAAPPGPYTRPPACESARSMSARTSSSNVPAGGALRGGRSRRPDARRAGSSGSDELGAGREDERALHEVLELAHVAGPVVRLERAPGVLADPRRAAVHRRRVAREEVQGERTDLLAPLAQRRQLDREDREPVVEVRAERAARDHLLEVAVRRGDDAHVDLDRLRAADALDDALLQHAQEPHLHRRAARRRPRRGRASRRRPARSAPRGAGSRR